MTKKRFVLTKIFLLSIISIVIFGCNYSINNSEIPIANDTFIIKGSIKIDDKLRKNEKNSFSANETSRTGLPSIPETDIDSFSVYATNGNQQIDGSIKTDEMEYSIMLPKGTWTITIIAKNVDKQQILQGTCLLKIDGNPITDTSITLMPTQSEGGTGNLELLIQKEEESISCVNVKAILVGFTEEKNFSFAENGNTTTISFSNVKSGTYELKIGFYDSDSCLIFTHYDSVNIYDGLTTDFWSGNTYDSDDERYKFFLTQEKINFFKKTTFYVSESGIEDEGTGSFFSPFKTIQEAVNKIIEVNDETSTYTIYVKDNITGEEDFDTTNSALINIVPEKKLNLKICGTQNADDTYTTINAKQKGRVMYIGENANVTLENLILTGGCLSDTNGAGLYILNSTAEVTIKNCEIKGNTIDNGCGAGIFVALNNESLEESLNLTIENSKIYSNAINHNDGVGEYSGAGIAIENVKANITITGSEITGNKINQKGITNTNPGDKGVGLWLGNKAVTTISGSTISGNIIENAASNNKNAGGGICIEGGTLTIKEATIISGNSSGYGGGVYVASGDVTMNGGVIGQEITENENDQSKQYSWQYAATETNHSNYADAGGGGIYATNGTVTINSGKISYNYVPDPDGNGDPYSTQLKQGGGIFIEGGTLTLKNAEVSYNRGYQGGGVRCSGTDTGFVSELKLDNATIKGNAGKYKNWSNFGGGLVIRKVTNVDFGTTPSIIEENYSADGGAVFIEDTTVTLKNITIQNNKYDTEGYSYGSEVLLWDKANVSIKESPDNVKIASNEGETQGICIHADSNGQTNALNLSGNVKLDTPIYLVKKTKINITGDLTAENVATITLDDTFTERTQVLQAVEGVILANQVGKFTVTPSSGTSWTIDSEGKLLKVDCYYVKSDSTNNGNGTVDAPFATIQEAVTAINTVNNKDIEFTICLNGDFTLTAPLTISKNVKITKYGETAKIIRGESFTADSLIKVETGATLTIADIVIDGNNVSTTETTGGAVYVNGGTLNFSSGTIQYCEASEGYGGGVYVAENGKLTMESGATIASCKAGLGGGVHVAMGIFTMSRSANIESCIVTSESGYDTRGGGVYVGGGTFTMSDNASIKNCEVDNGDGGGVYITYSGKFTMTGGTIENCKASLSGGGVWMNSGSSFTMSNESKIENCTASGNEGGGVYATDTDNPCTFTMSGNATISNCTAGKGGGGVSYGCGVNGTFEISDNVVISNNTSTSTDFGGGGVYLYGKLVMTGGTISDNTAYNGAGVYVRDNSVFEMSGDTISENTATSYGGGVYVSSSGSFKMTSGTISENTVDPNGSGVYVSATGAFTMSGGAYVASDNDVYLSATGSTVTIAGELTPPEGTTTVATITPRYYEADTQVLTAGKDERGEDLVHLAEQVGKFAVTSDSSETRWTIDLDGKLQKQE